MAEKDKLLRELDACKQQLGANSSSHTKHLDLSIAAQEIKSASAEEIKVSYLDIFGFNVIYTYACNYLTLYCKLCFLII